MVLSFTYWRYTRYTNFKRESPKDANDEWNIIKDDEKIDWSGFELLGSGNLGDENQSSKNIESEFEIVEDGIVDKDTLLSNTETRNLVLANLNEVDFFQRAYHY